MAVAAVVPSDGSASRYFGVVTPSFSAVAGATNSSCAPISASGATPPTTTAVEPNVIVPPVAWRRSRCSVVPITANPGPVPSWKRCASLGGRNGTYAEGSAAATSTGMAYPAGGRSRTPPDDDVEPDIHAVPPSTWTTWATLGSRATVAASPSGSGGGPRRGSSVHRDRPPPRAEAARCHPGPGSHRARANPGSARPSPPAGRNLRHGLRPLPGRNARVHITRAATSAIAPMAPATAIRWGLLFDATSNTDARVAVARRGMLEPPVRARRRWGAQIPEHRRGPSRERHRHRPAHIRRCSGRARRGAALSLGVLTAVGSAWWSSARCSRSASRDPSIVRPVNVGRPAPDFALKTLDGTRTVRLSSLRGQVGGPELLGVRGSMPGRAPGADANVDRYRDQGVVVLGMDFDDAAGAARSFASQLGITYPLLTDPGDRSALAYGVTGPPETFLIGRTGVIEGRTIGPVVFATLSAEIQTLLAGAAG